MRLHVGRSLACARSLPCGDGSSCRQPHTAPTADALPLRALMAPTRPLATPLRASAPSRGLPPPHPRYKCVTFHQVRDNQISVAPALHSVAGYAFSRYGARPRSCVCMSVGRSLALAPCGVGMAPVVAIPTPHRLQTHSLCVPSWLLRVPSPLRYVPPLLRGGSRPHTPAPCA